MKKAKFMLLGIGVLGVAGGALAFNASKYNGSLFCTDQVSAACDQNQLYNPTDHTSSDPVKLYCSTNRFASPCAAISQTVSLNP